MAEISSFNMKQSTDFQVFHNANIRPNYAIGGKVECNRNGYEAKELKETIINKAKQAYIQRTKRAFQAKSYQWSAVCNIKPETTMQDLEKLAKHFFDKYGFQCYQIAIHRDEGYIDENSQKQINHHAHLEFITLDKETGKNRQREIKPNTLRQIQTETAQILQMQRGVDKRISKAKRIEPRKYAQLKEQEKEAIKATKIKVAKQIKELKAQLEAEILSKKELKEQFEAFRKENAGQGLAKEFFRELSEEKKKQLQEPSYTQDELKDYFNELLEKHTSKKKGFFGEKEIIDYQKIIQEQQQTISDLNAKNDDLKQITNKSIEFIDQKVKIDLNAKFELLKQQNEIYLKEQLKKRKNELEYELIQEKNQVTIEKINLQKQIDYTAKIAATTLKAEQEHKAKIQELEAIKLSYSENDAIKELKKQHEEELEKEREKQANLKEQNKNLKEDNERLEKLNEFAMEMKKKAEQELKEIKQRLQNITEAVERAVKGSWQIVYDRSTYGFKSAHIKLKEFFSKEPQEQEKIINSNIQAHKDIEREKQKKNIEREKKSNLDRGF